MADNSNKLVLVTGGTGFISSHAVKAFLDNGYRVRTTCRDPDNREKAKALYAFQAELDDPSRLEIVKAADLNEPQCWMDAAKGCNLCAHLASPFFFPKGKDGERLMCKSAVDGTLNVLRACEANGIKRVVVTSSMAAVSYGHGDIHGQTIEKPEEMWSVEDNIHGYVLSKLLAERAAWDFVKNESKIGMELSTINPTYVVGPPFTGNNATSHEFIVQCLTGKLPGLPDVVMNAVDVRDVALAHVRALERPEAVGKRFCAVGPDYFRLREMAAALREELGPLGYRKIPKKNVPKWILSMASWFNKQYKQVVSNVGVEPIVFKTTQSETILGIKYRPTCYDSHIQQAHALIQHGHKLIPMTPEYEQYLAAKNGGGGAAEEAPVAVGAMPSADAAAEETAAAESTEATPAADDNEAAPADDAEAKEGDAAEATTEAE